MKKTLFIIVCLLQIPLFAFKSFSADADGGLPGYFLKLGFGARYLALGRTGAAYADDIGSIYYNPASLRKLRRKQLLTDYSLLFEDSRANTLAYAGYYRRFNYALAFMQLASGDVEVRDTYNNPGESIRSYDNAYFLSASYQISRKLYVGANIKAVQNIFDDINNTGYGADLAVLYSLRSERLKIALNLQNIVKPNLERNYGNSDIPINIKYGMSYSIWDSLLIALDLNKNEYGNYKFHFGAEYMYRFLALRLGYDVDKITYGTGIIYKNYCFDYAVFSHFLGYYHMASLSYKFGKERPKDNFPIKLKKSMGISYKDKSKSYEIEIRAADSIPLGIYNLLEEKSYSIISLTIENKTNEEKKVKLSYKILDITEEEYRIIDLKPKEEMELSVYPTITKEKIESIKVHQESSINIDIHEIDNKSGNLNWILNAKEKIILDPYDHYFLRKKDSMGKIIDLTETLVSWVTFNNRDLSPVLSQAAEQGAKLDPPVKFIGSQVPEMFTRIIEDKRSLEEKDADCLKQIELIYNTLVDKYKLTYLNQPVVYNKGQRIKYPAETLAQKGNCIELAVLMASLLEGIEIEPLLLLFPQDGHATVAWRVKKDDECHYRVIEANLFGEDFTKLIDKGEELIEDYGLDRVFNSEFELNKNGIYHSQDQKTVFIDVKTARNTIPPSFYNNQNKPKK